MQDLSQLSEFYLSGTGAGENLFDIWERGEGRGDSVTPSTYSFEYRQWMSQLLMDLLADAPGGLVSIGSGNAVIESALTRAGHRVLAVDALQEAVDCARLKGVEAARADVRVWTPPPENWSVVYADGLLGHLYEPEEGLLPVLNHVRTWLEPTQGTIVISNDHTQSGSGVEPAPGVPGFHWLSEEFLRKETAAAGFQEVSCVLFTYQRPLSGPRTRVVLTGRA
jgi:hypothetical protein